MNSLTFREKLDKRFAQRKFPLLASYKVKHGTFYFNVDDVPDIIKACEKLFKIGYEQTYQYELVSTTNISFSEYFQQREGICFEDYNNTLMGLPLKCSLVAHMQTQIEYLKRNYELDMKAVRDTKEIDNIRNGNCEPASIFYFLLNRGNREYEYFNVSDYETYQ